MKTNLTLSYIDDAYDKYPKTIEDIEKFLSEAVEVCSPKKRVSYGIMPFINLEGRTKEHFTASNVAFIDIDDKEDFRVTRQIFAAPDYFLRMFPEIYFIQKSRNGATHIVFEIEEQKTKAEWEEYVDAYYKYFCDKFKENYGKLNVMDVLDKSMKTPTQALFINNSEIIFNKNFDNDGVKSDIFGQINKLRVSKKNPISNTHFSGVTKVKENVTFDTTSSKEQDSQALTDRLYFKNFKNEDIKIPYILNQYIPDFEYRGLQPIDSLVDDIIHNIRMSNTSGKWYNKMRIGDNVLYGIRIDAFNEFYDENNNVIKIQRGERKKTLRLWIKRYVLNGIATCNHFGDYSNLATDLASTIYHGWYKNIEWGNGDGYFGVKELCDTVECTFKNWNSIYVPVSYNKYWTAPEQGTFESDEKLFGWLRKLADGKYKMVDATFKDLFYGEIQLKGLKNYTQIADYLNANNISAKTKKGWTSKNVRDLMGKLNITIGDDFSVRMNELLGEGKNYSEIASILNDEGYTTKQGKEFTTDSVKNYVRRKK